MHQCSIFYIVDLYNAIRYKKTSNSLSTFLYKCKMLHFYETGYLPKEAISLQTLHFKLPLKPPPCTALSLL